MGSDDFAKRVRDYRESVGLSQEQFAKRLGITRNYVGMIEAGKEPSDQIVLHFDLLEQSAARPTRRTKTQYQSQGVIQEGPRTDAALFRPRLVPVISWAKAGESTGADFATVYSEETVATDTTDPLAFGVTIRGDSMEPIIQAGDIVILVPSQQAQSGDIVVARLKDGGVICKLFHLKGRDGKLFILTSQNPAYPPLERSEEDFWWIYPVDSVNKKLRR